MKTRFIAIALAMTSLSALAAGEATYDAPRTTAGSGLTRADVQIEVKLAREQGALVFGELSYVAPAAAPALSRVQVRADLERARQNHELVSGELSFDSQAHAGS